MLFCENRLRKLIENPELLNALREAFCDQFPSDGLENLSFEGRIVRGRGWVSDVDDFPNDPLTEVLDSIFEKFVIAKIGEPAPLVDSDLTAIAIAQLTGLSWEYGVESEEITRGLERVVAFAIAELSAEREGKKRFDLGSWDPSVGKSIETEHDRIELWSSPTGFRVFAHPKSFNGINYFVTSSLRAECSHLAMLLAQTLFGPILESVAKSIELCFTEGDKPMVKSGPLFEQLEKLKFGEDRETKAVKVTPIDFLTDGDGKRMLCTSLDAYCRNADDDEDTLLERLRNATILLAHADQIDSDPLALALSFAAIEALVCEKEENVGKQIRQHVPTLLESEPTRRTAKRRDMLYDLYELRSQVLHGSRLSASREASHVVRRIAAGAIRAICVWRGHQEKAQGEKPTWKDLITELIIASRNGQAVIPAVPGLGELLPNEAPK